MATTTPNFGWAVPTSTDLVKDGAVAIETLGDSIDASLVDLKGGTTGQVLSKASNADMDFTWVTDAAGDITGVTAGTGISGGGTSGTVTVTNSMATAIDAKGDLIGGTGADAFARLAVGANGTVLTADSAEATGLKWATPAGGTSFSGVQVTNSVSQSIASGVETNLTFNSETFDTSSYHSTVTNTDRLTVPTTGYYWVYAKITWANNGTGFRYLFFRKNGTGAGQTTINMPVSGAGFTQYLGLVISATAGDYFDTRVAQLSGGALNVEGADNNGVVFGCYYLGA
jgi:hypothetical protein